MKLSISEHVYLHQHIWNDMLQSNVRKTELNTDLKNFNCEVYQMDKKDKNVFLSAKQCTNSYKRVNASIRFIN